MVRPTPFLRIYMTPSTDTAPAHPLFDPQVLPYLVQPLIAFTPPLLTAPPPPNFAQPSLLRTSLLQADFDLLSESCSQLESLALDVEDIRLSLARGFQFPAEHQNVPCLSVILNFIEQGNYAPLWYVQHETSFDSADVRNQEKAFDDCKAAVIKAIVEMSGEDKNVDVLIDPSDQIRPGGAFVSRMVNWIRAFVTSGQYGNARDDLVICATLSLGNVTRRGIVLYFFLDWLPCLQDLREQNSIQPFCFLSLITLPRFSPRRCYLHHQLISNSNMVSSDC